MDQQIKFCTTSDGVRIAYATTGSGYALVWCPGWLSHAEIDWDVPGLGDRYRELTKHFTLYRIDKRGTGLSQRRVGPYTREKWVLDLEAVAEHAGLDKFALAGYSEGGPIAIEYAARHPEKITHLLLMGTGAYDPGTEPELQDTINALVTIIRLNWGTATKMMTDFFFGEDVPHDAQQRFADYQRQSAEAEDAASMLEHAAETMQIGHIAPQVQAPTLVIHGRTDQAVPIRLGQRLASLIPNASFKSIEGQHVPDRAQSAVMEAAIKDFVLGPRADKGIEVNEAPSSTGGPVTILFTDMEASSALRQRLGDERVQKLVHVHDAIVRTSLAEFEGREIKHTGDGIMASFPSATRGLRCAIAIQRGVAEHVSVHPEDPLSVYVGLNAGEPISEREDLFGTSVDLAARICALAEPGQILASNVVRELAAGKDFLFADNGEVIPKGFEEPVHVFEVRWQD